MLCCFTLESILHFHLVWICIPTHLVTNDQTYYLFCLVLIGKQGGRGLLVLYQKANVWRAVCLYLCSLSHRVSQFIIKCVCVWAQNLFCPHHYPSMPLWAQRRPSSGVSGLVRVDGDRACCVLSLRYMDAVTGLSEEALTAQARLSLVKGPV